MTVYDKKEFLGLTSFPSRDFTYSCRFVAQFYSGEADRQGDVLGILLHGAFQACHSQGVHDLEGIKMSIE